MILVTGGTGLVGSHLLYQLTTTNERVRAIKRSTSDINTVKHIFTYYTTKAEAATLFKKIEWVDADITDIPALEVAFNNVEIVYHCAAYIHFNPSKFEILKKVNIEGTANIVNLCLFFKVQKLCYVSTIATLGKSDTEGLITEETHFNQDGDHSVYALTKYAAEMEVWRGIQEGLHAVIVNPGVIFGAGHWNSGSGVIVGLGKRAIPYYFTGGVGVVDVRDVVSCMILLVNAAISNERFILVSENKSYRELMSSLAVLFNKKPPAKPLAKWKMKVISKLEWLFSAVFRTKRKLLPATVNALYNSAKYDGGKVTKHINFNYTPFTTTIKRVVAIYKTES